MKVSYSLKHATEKFDNPLLGTETTDGLYADVCPHGTMFTVLISGEDSHWFTPEYPLSAPIPKSCYINEGDKRFAVFPQGSVIVFTQDSIL